MKEKKIKLNLSDMSHKVIDLDLSEKRPVEITKRAYRKCQHRYVDVDDVLRKVHCRKCGTELDPIQVLIGLATEYRLRDYKIKQLEDLEHKRERRNFKAREQRQAKREAEK